MCVEFGVAENESLTYKLFQFQYMTKVTDKIERMRKPKWQWWTDGNMVAGQGKS